MSSRFAGICLTGLLLYFAFHAFAGNKGLGRWSDMQRELVEKKGDLAVLEAQIVALEIDIERLSPGTVDPDLVEAIAREKLAYVYPNEIVLMGDRTSSAFWYR